MIYLDDTFGSIQRTAEIIKQRGRGGEITVYLLINRL
jgi:hypothetical protein